MSVSRPSPPRKSLSHLRLEEESLNKHQAKTEETRGKLLKSARKIFAQVGFEAARLEDIASDAGHTRGAFYAHFSSKEDLFFALLEQQIYIQLEHVQTIMDAQKTRRAKLQVLRDHYVTKLSDPNWSMLMLEFKMFAIRRPKMRARLAAAHREMRASVRIQGISELISAQGSRQGVSEDGVRVILESFLQCLILQMSYDPLSLSGDDATAALGKVFDLLVGLK